MSHDDTAEMGPPTAVYGASPMEVFKRVDHNKYLKMASNGAIQTEPAVVHFGGFELNKTYRQIVLVKNVSDNVERVRVSQPKTDQFKSRLEQKGNLGKGIAERVTIEFTPTEYKYYYDSIRVLCQSGESMFVPIHAYPVANETFFPSSLDVGDHASGSTMTKVVPLRCKVPVEFEFDITVLESSVGFKVWPLKGVIPANGEVDITIEFHPLSMILHRMLIQVSVAQFNFDPIICEIVGSCSPGIVRNDLKNERQKEWSNKEQDSTLNQLTTEVRDLHHDKQTESGLLKLAKKQENAEHEDMDDGNIESLLNSQISMSRKSNHDDEGLARQVMQQFRESIEANSTENIRRVLKDKNAVLRNPRGPGSGSVVDPGGEWMRLNEKKQQETLKQKRKLRQDMIARGEIIETDKSMIDANGDGIIDDNDLNYVLVDGFSIPRAIHGVQAANSVLTQEKGKLALRDLHDAIEKHRQARLLELTQRASAGLDTDITKKPCVSDMELEEEEDEIDEQGYASIVRRIVEVEQGAMDQNKPRQVKELCFLQAVKEARDSDSRSTQFKGDNIGQDLLTEEEMEEIGRRREAMDAGRARAQRGKSRETWTAVLQGPHSSMSPAKVMYDQVKVEQLKRAYIPTFDGIDNDVWGTRRNVLTRFIRVVSCVIIRNRANSRIKLIKEFVGASGGRSREQVRQLVEQENRNPDAMVGAQAVKRQQEKMEKGEAWARYRNKVQGFVERANAAAIKLMPAEEVGAHNDDADKGNVNKQKADVVEEARKKAEKKTAAAEIRTDSRGSGAGTRTSKAGTSETDEFTAPAKGLPIDAVQLYHERSRVSLEVLSSLKMGKHDALVSVHPFSFPLFEDNVEALATQFPVSITRDFDDAEFFQLRQPREFQLCNYAEHELPRFPDNIPQCADQQLRHGAVEECGNFPSILCAPLYNGAETKLVKRTNGLRLSVAESLSGNGSNIVGGNGSIRGMLGCGDLSGLISPVTGGPELVNQRCPCAVLENVENLKTEMDPELVLQAKTADPIRAPVTTFGIRWSKTPEHGAIATIARSAVLSEYWRPRRERSDGLQVWASECVERRGGVGGLVAAGEVGLAHEAWRVRGLPELMSGPREEDQMSDDEGEAEEDSTGGGGDQDEIVESRVASQRQNSQGMNVTVFDADRVLMGTLLDGGDEEEKEEEKEEKEVSVLKEVNADAEWTSTLGESACVPRERALRLLERRRAMDDRNLRGRLSERIQHTSDLFTQQANRRLVGALPRAPQPNTRSGDVDGA